VLDALRHGMREHTRTFRIDLLRGPSEGARLRWPIELTYAIILCRFLRFENRKIALGKPLEEQSQFVPVPVPVSLGCLTL